MQMINPNASQSGSSSSTHALNSSMSNLNAALVESAPRVLILTQSGGLLIVDIDGFQVRNVGFYAVKVSTNKQY
jgi:hypothetical protein